MPDILCINESKIDNGNFDKVLLFIFINHYLIIFLFINF